mmetsp:Transcript_47826/g.74529  ORF Transcript_47826/g.74529 Transcript_47826/m.74529 type:complete len:258 (-) Transcript_47826:300-1073(-)
MDAFPDTFAIAALPGTFAIAALPGTFAIGALPGTFTIFASTRTSLLPAICDDLPLVCRSGEADCADLEKGASESPSDDFAGTPGGSAARGDKSLPFGSLGLTSPGNAARGDNPLPFGGGILGGLGFTNPDKPLPFGGGLLGGLGFTNRKDSVGTGRGGPPDGLGGDEGVGGGKPALKKRGPFDAPGKGVQSGGPPRKVGRLCWNGGGAAFNCGASGGKPQFTWPKSPQRIQCAEANDTIAFDAIVGQDTGICPLHLQ